MTKEAVEAIIGKAVVDAEFRAALLADPDRALAGFDLTAEEVARLKAVDAESIETLAGTLDERISKSMGFGLGSLAPTPSSGHGSVPPQPPRGPDPG